MRRPHSEAMRGCAASAAGIEAAPGSVKPSASAIVVIVEAVPMVMQVPAERAMPASISFHCSSLILPASFSAQYFHTSEPEPRMLPPKWPRIIGPAGMKIIGRFIEMPPMIVAGVVLSHPPISTAPSTGCWRRSSSVSIARKLR